MLNIGIDSRGIETKKRIRFIVQRKLQYCIRNNDRSIEKSDLNAVCIGDFIQKFKKASKALLNRYYNIYRTNVTNILGFLL